MDGGAWWATVHGVAKSGTRLSDFTFTFHFHELEKEMATHSSVLALRIPGMGEPGGLLSMGSHRVRHNWSDLAACSFYDCFPESFYHKWVLNFVKGFSASIEIIAWFLFFNLLIWYITLIHLWILKNSCIPGIKFTWSCMMYDPLWSTFQSNGNKSKNKQMGLN